MKKILITLLVLITFGFNTYNVGAVDKQITKTSAYYLKIDKILSKFFIKIDKKGETKAKTIYKKIISKIDILVKKSKSDKKTKILNYIKVKFVEKLEKKKIQEKIKDTTKKQKTDNSYRTDNGDGTASSHFEMSQDEKLKANQRAATNSKVTKDEVIFSSSEKTYDEVYGLLFNNRASIQHITTALQQEYNAIQNNKTYSKNVMNKLKEDYKKSYNLFMGGALKEISKTGITSHNGFSMYESIVFYYSKGNQAQKQVLKDLGYRLENGKIVYKDELNLLKNRIKQLNNITKKTDNSYRTDNGDGTASSHFEMSQDEKLKANQRVAAEESKYLTRDEVIFGRSEKTYYEVYDLLFDSRASIEHITTALQQEYNAIQNNKTYSKNVINKLKEDYKKSYNLFMGGALKETSKTGITSHNGYSMYESIVFYYSKGNKAQKQVLKDLGYRLENGKIVYKNELNLLKNKIQKID